MEKDELQLLRSYLAGPRIWDAAAVVPVVRRLAAQGFIEPAGEHGGYQLTAAGRTALSLTAAGRTVLGLDETGR